MGQCYGKYDGADGEDSFKREELPAPKTPKHGSCSNRGSFNNGGASPLRHKATSFGSSQPSPRHPSASPLPHYASSPANASTPRRLFKRPFPPPSPAKHIQSSLVKRHGAKPKDGGPIPDAVENEKPLDKHFGYPKNFTQKYELGHEVGRGHFGHTCYAKMRRGEQKGQPVAVKIISKAKVCSGLSPARRFDPFVQQMWHVRVVVCGGSRVLKGVCRGRFGSLASMCSHSVWEKLEDTVEI